MPALPTAENNLMDIEVRFGFAFCIATMNGVSVQIFTLPTMYESTIHLQRGLHLIDKHHNLLVP